MTAKRIFHARVRQMLVILALSASLPIGSVLADTIAIKGDAPQSYTVVKGDTLWDISGKYLEQPWRWPDLWEGNPQIANPHLIYPGDVISLYYQDGQPRLGINRARGTVKLSPKIRSSVIDDAIPVIPIEAIQHFLRKLKILDKASIDGAPYIIRAQEARIIAAKGERIYIKGLPDANDDSRYQIYRSEDPINDPATGDIIGYEGIYIGDAKFDRAGDPATLLITSSVQEAAVGDIIVVRESDDVLTNFHPKVPSQQVSGVVLNIIDGVGIFSNSQAVIINIGASDGLGRGHVLSIFSKGETVPDDVSPKRGDTVTLPDERAGTLMVVKAFENLSYAITMESRLPMRLLDEVHTPE